jgi:hypothetical protein
MAGGNSNADVQRMTDGVIGSRGGDTAARRTMNCGIAIVILASSVAVALEENGGSGRSSLEFFYAPSLIQKRAYP